MEQSFVDGSPIIEIDNAKSNLDIHKWGKAICKISIESPLGAMYGTGVLCRFPCNGEPLVGLVTCCHIVNCLEEIVIEFELVYARISIQPDDIKWMFTDQKLDVTFFVFSDMMNRLLLRRRPIIPVRAPSGDLQKKHLTVLQYPEGKVLSVSKGNILSSQDFNVSYTCSTIGGSAGAAILDDESQLVAIHKQSGPIVEIRSAHNYAKYNIGTLMSTVDDAISSAKPWDNPRWKSQWPLNSVSSFPSVEKQSKSVLQSAAKYLCRLYISRSYKKFYGNGFLCRIKLFGEVPTYGIFTNKHVLLHKLEDDASMEMTFGSDDSQFTLQASDIDWVYSDLKLHFTFLALNAESLKKVKYETDTFLSISKSRPPCGSKFYLIEHPENSEAILFEGVLKDWSDIYLFHDGAVRPQINGSIILNANSEVIGVGSTCGWFQQIGTSITEDLVRGILCEMEINSKCPLIKDVTDIDVTNSAAAVCKIKTSSKTFTGFLCDVKLPKNVSYKGLFTTYDGIKRRKKFSAYFDKVRDYITVELPFIKHFFYDKTLGYTFMAFSDEFIKELTKEEKKLPFLSLTTVEVPVSSSILLLHYPKEIEPSLSRGIVKVSDDIHLHHLSYTSLGSAGAPILNEDQQVIAIHMGTGPICENDKSTYKQATKITEVVQNILMKRLLVTV